MADRKTVVITGSTGRIGTLLRQAFADRYTLHGRKALGYTPRDNAESFRG